MANELVPSSGYRELELRSELISRRRLTRDEARIMPLWEYFVWWSGAYKKGRVTDVTLGKYLGNAQSIQEIVPFMKLQDLERNRYNLQMLLDKYGLTHQHLTLLNFKGHLFTILRSAVEDGHIDGISTQQLQLTSAEHYWTLEKRQEKRQAPKVMSESDYRMFKTRVDILLQDALTKPPEYAGFGGYFHHYRGNKPISNQTRLMILAVLLHTGCRFAEALGVRAADFSKTQMSINKTWQYKAGMKAEFAPTKNESSIRSVFIDSTLYDDVQTYCEWKLRHFTGLQNKPLSYEPKTVWYNATLNDFFRKLQKEFGISANLSIHKIRHTYISYLLNQGINEGTIAKQVGHTDTNMIHRVYGHLLEERKEQDKLRIASLMR